MFLYLYSFINEASKLFLEERLSSSYKYSSISILIVSGQISLANILDKHLSISFVKSGEMSSSFPFPRVLPCVCFLAVCILSPLMFLKLFLHTSQKVLEGST